MRGSRELDAGDARGRRNVVDVGLVGAGIGMFVGGYLGATITGWYFGSLNTVYLSFGGGVGAQVSVAPNWGWSFIPFLNPVALLNAHSTTARDVLWATELLSLGLQLGGVACLVLGLVGSPAAVEGTHGSVTFTPFAGPDGSGMALRGTF